MNTAKSKRWNGKIETLTTDYLNRVLEQMLAYGDRVQFALPGGGPHPHYRVTNTSGKTMSFDGEHLLSNDSGAFASPLFTLEQIEAAIKGVSSKPVGAGTSGGGGGGTRTTAAQKLAEVEAAKYAYFKSNRAALPADIGQHAEEITALMLNGMAAEDAFAEVIKRHS